MFLNSVLSELHNKKFLLTIICEFLCDNVKEEKKKNSSKFILISKLKTGHIEFFI